MLMLMFFMVLLLIFAVFNMNVDTHDCLMALFFIELMIYSFLYVSKWYHLMMLLMILELFMLKIYFISAGFSMTSEGSYFTFFFITLSVAEASIGLSLLTLLVRSNGDDYIFIDSF